MGEMREKSDIQLLRDYAERRDEAAFRELVTRSTNLVYSAALRQVESSAIACDIAQGVFTDLARKARQVAGKMPAESSLAGWLHRSTRYAALNHLRDTRRRRTNERQAMEQLLTNSESTVNWEQIRPMLDEALDSLGDEDREALLLRFFQKKDFRAVGLALGVGDDAAQKRVSRAVERLREFFSKSKVSIGASGLAVLISANAVQSAPAGLAVAISATALAGTAVITSTAFAVTKTIAMTTLQKTIIGATLTAVVGAGVFEARLASQLRDQVQMLQQQQAPLVEQNRQLQRERVEATNRLAGLADELARAKSSNLELLKLRGEVGTLHNQLERLKTIQSAELTTNSTKPTSHSPGAYILIGQLNNAGRSTPEAAFETQAWAMVNSNYEEALESFTPERKAAELERADDREDFLKASHMVSGTMKGIQIMAKKILSADRVELKVKNAFDVEMMRQFIKTIPSGLPTNLPSGTNVVPLVKIGDEWKMDTSASPTYEEKWDADGQVQIYMP
jgi:RNA polymerase sigma factor (sigma-70 family)